MYVEAEKPKIVLQQLAIHDFRVHRFLVLHPLGKSVSFHVEQLVFVYMIRCGANIICTTMQTLTCSSMHLLERSLFHGTINIFCQCLIVLERANHVGNMKNF